ncbi:hypothetical protein [Rhodococcus sp. NPDC127528]|uniref:hypothetical protein n=1 Tax=unclassified Rhodococcus (in: high G+C Gram-positive bacteria) TaxID=192944 RepID=UPI0036447CE0
MVTATSPLNVLTSRMVCVGPGRTSWNSQTAIATFVEFLARRIVNNSRVPYTTQQVHSEALSARLVDFRAGAFVTHDLAR